MTALTFEVPGQPVPKARPVVTRHGTFTPKKTRDYEASIAAGYTAAVRGKAVPKNTAVIVSITAYMQVPKTKRRPEESPHTIRPDVDNIIKAVLDGLRDAWEDDCQVYKVIAAKRWSKDPRTVISIWTTDEKREEEAHETGNDAQAQPAD